MSDLKLFRVAGGQAAEIPGAAVALERHLQTLIEQNMEAMLGIRFLASEYSTGSWHRGRIDSLGLDESGNPVIIEYKRSNGKALITQALSCLSWLRDHRHEFESLVKERLGNEAPQNRPTRQEPSPWLSATLPHHPLRTPAHKHCAHALPSRTPWIW
ncbi:hypothetical protein [Streptomyces sp. NPDC029674]|uniref:hypothetical protein n=1 Tax=Streptomyces sp. NPDC029674 TaxID=3365297 RepID=UPI0038511A87